MKNEFHSYATKHNNRSQFLRIIGDLKSQLFVFNDMDENKLMEHKAITLAHKPLIVYIITALMISASIIYFYVAYQDYQELSQTSSSTDSKDSANILATRNEMSFFLIVGIAYIPVAIWMLNVKHNNKIPYIISIVGSSALIIFYILTRVVDIPAIGLQTDIGVIDITAKIIQAGIVSISSFLITSVIIRNRSENTPARGVSKRKESIERTKDRK